MVEERKKNHLSLLKDLVRIPSMSTDPSSKTAVQEASRWLVDHLKTIGADEVRVLETPLHPVVWAQFRSTRSGDVPTLLIYGHYDVQPVDPLDLWESPPFEPEQRGHRLYGRGASDMKGQVMATIHAVAAAVAAGDLPVHVRFLLEGEEEMGSPSLAGVLKEHGELFKADVCLNPDTGMIAKGHPSIQYGLRGLAYFDLTVRGPARDLHSGQFGGVVHNPLQALSELISGMHDEYGRVTLPDFYDSVRTISEEEQQLLSSVPVTNEAVQRTSGVPSLWGEPEYSVPERIGARPTLEINGMWGGYTGEGSKTVIPAEAHAKISTRLVPDQDYRQIRGQLERYLHEHAPATVRWELNELAGGQPFICDPDSPAHAAFARALEAVWQTKPLRWRIGGSVPVARDLQDMLGVPSVLSGFALSEDQVHSPNESIDLQEWYKGIEAVTRFLYELVG